MGKALADAFPVARAVFDEVDDALSQKLSAIMWDGPKETLTLTENAQPALMAVSMAVMRVLETDKGFSLKDKVKYVAGHSLGEYSALAAAGAFSLADAARLLKLRGQAMQKPRDDQFGVRYQALWLMTSGRRTVTPSLSRMPMNSSRHFPWPAPTSAAA